MKPGMTLDDISEDLLLDCASLVKANSIIGCKRTSVYVIYTRWKNLKKTADMVAGAVSYFRPDNVKRMEVEKNNPIVKQIDKTKEEKHPDLYMLQQDRLREIQREKKDLMRKEQKEKEKARHAAQVEKEANSYDHMMKQENMTSAGDMQASADATAAEDYEDDFF
jgi:hypothetical protein